MALSVRTCPAPICSTSLMLAVPIPTLPLSVMSVGAAPVPLMYSFSPDIVPMTFNPTPAILIVSAPVIVSPLTFTYRASPSVWLIISAVPQVSVPSLCVVMMEQLARLVTARELPVIPPATSNLVPGVVVPMPTLPSGVMRIRSPTVPEDSVWNRRLELLAPSSTPAIPASALPPRSKVRPAPRSAVVCVLVILIPSRPIEDVEYAALLLKSTSSA